MKICLCCSSKTISGNVIVFHDQAASIVSRSSEAMGSSPTIFSPLNITLELSGAIYRVRLDDRLYRSSHDIINGSSEILHPFYPFRGIAMGYRPQ